MLSLALRIRYFLKDPSISIDYYMSFFNSMNRFHPPSQEATGSCQRRNAYLHLLGGCPPKPWQRRTEASARFRRNRKCHGLLPVGLHWTLAFFAILFTGLANGQNTSSQAEEDDWGILMMQGKRIGFTHTISSKRVTDQGTQWITESYERMKFKRLGTELLTITSSKIIENDQGSVLSFEKNVQGAGMNSTVRGYHIGNELVILSRGIEQRYPFPQEALGPRAADQKARTLPLAVGAKMELKVFMSDFPQTPVTVKMNVNRKEPKEVLGKKLELWNTTAEMSVLPGIKVTVWLDDHSEEVASLMPFPGIGDLEQIRTTRQEAMKELESVEFLATTLIVPTSPLKNVPKLSKATFRLSTTKNEPLKLWSGGEQIVTKNGNDSSEITVTVPHYQESAILWTLPHAASKDLDEYLKATPFLEAKSQAIEELARKAVGEEKNPLRAAKKIETFVRQYIYKKDLSVGFASAEETARSQQGDCTEHAVLAAAMGRAIGLPTRIVVGLGYAPVGYSSQGKSSNGMFGFHMWAEAWLGENQWVTMDAALNGFDVGHIAFAKSSLQEASPEMDLTIPLLQMMGQLKIDVLSTE